MSNWGYRGATGMFSTTVDIYHWILALRNGSILKKESLEQLWAFQALIRHVSETTDLYYGYGWNVIAKNNKRVFVKHTGSEDWLGHNGVMCVYENLDIYIVLSNAGEREERGWSTIVSNYLQEKLQT